LIIIDPVLWPQLRLQRRPRIKRSIATLTGLGWMLVALTAPPVGAAGVSSVMRWLAMARAPEGKAGADSPSVHRDTGRLVAFSDAVFAHHHHPLDAGDQATD